MNTDRILLKPFWHVVVSAQAPVIDKAIRRRDVAEEYAEKCSKTYPGVEIIPLVSASVAVALKTEKDALVSVLEEVERWWMTQADRSAGAPACMFAVRAAIANCNQTKETP